MSDRKHCIGCDSDFYNGRDNFTGRDCWHRKNAKVVTRYKIGWWTQPTVPGAFQKVTTHQCHTESGKYAFYEKLPSFATPATKAASDQPVQNKWNTP